MKKGRAEKAREYVRGLKISAAGSLVGGIILIIASAYFWGMAATVPVDGKKIVELMALLVALFGFILTLDGAYVWYCVSKIEGVLRELAA